MFREPEPEVDSRLSRVQTALMPSVTSATSNAHKALGHRNIKNTMERRADLVLEEPDPGRLVMVEKV